MTTTTSIPTMTELTSGAAGCTLHHSAWHRGYISRKTAGIVEPYSGRYGTGYRIFRPSWQSSRYCIVEYYVA